MKMLPMATVVGNTIRVRTTWTDWDSGSPVSVDAPTLTCRFRGRVVDTIQMSESVVPGTFEAYWTPAIVGTYDLHVSAMVDGHPEASHRPVTVRA